MNRLECKFLDLKVAGDGEPGRSFSGYGAVFGNVDFFGDMIVPGAFADTLQTAKDTNQWPSMLLQHGFSADMDMPIGIWTDISEDSIGLHVEGKLAETSRGTEVYELLKMEPRPAINGLSIGYSAVEWSARTKPEEPRRTLKKINLAEVSLVTFPANPKARVNAVKSEVRIRDAERALRDAGFSRSEALKILADGYKAIPLSDSEEMTDEIAAIVRRSISTWRS